MDIVFLIKLAMGLIVILAFLIFLFFYSKKKRKKVIAVEEKPEIDLNSLRVIIRDKKSSSKELKKALDLVLKYYGTIHPNFDIYMEILITICSHPNTTTKIVVGFDKALSKLNPDYKTKINNAITKGLNSRGV